MAGGDDTPKVPPKDRGTGDKGTGDRLTRDAPGRGSSAPAVNEAAMAQSIVDLRDKYRADVEGLIKLGERLQKEFKAAGKKLPLVRRTAAQELLRVYKALQDFESALPRGPGGVLMQRTPFSKKPVPWPGRPRALDRIAPFSDANVKEWRAAAQEAGAPIPARTPKKYPTGPPKVIKKADDSFFKVFLIKVPGMSLAHAVGKNILMAKILRVLSHQALTEKEAAAIAPKLDIWKYLVLDYGDTPEHKTKVLDSFDVGFEYGVKLKNEFLAEAQKLSPKPLDTKQRITAPVNEFSREYRPDNSEDERAWYAALRMKGAKRDRDSGYKPGEVVSKDGIVFVGPETGDSMFMAPDGRLYLVKQASLHDQQLEAVRIGVVNAAGGVILGWAVVILGAAAIAGPAAVGAASEALGATLLGSEVAGTAAAGTGLLDSVLYSRFAVWLGMNWHVVLAEGGFYFGLGAFVYNFNPRQFAEDFKRDPVAALTDLAQQLASLAHDAGEARQAGLNVRPQGGIAAAPDDEPPPTLPPASRPTTSTGQDEPTITTPVRPAAPTVADDTPTTTPTTRPTAPPAPADDPQPPTRNDVLRRDTGNKLLQDGKPANDNRLTNPAANDNLVADEVAPPVVMKRTGTDDLPITDDGTTGVTTASRDRNSRSTNGTIGRVTPATGSGGGGSDKGSGSGGGSGNGGGSGKGGSGGGKGGPGKGGGGSDGGDGGDDDEAARNRGTARNKPAAANDNDRAIGPARQTLGARGPWKPVAPPEAPRYTDRRGPLLQRLLRVRQIDDEGQRTNAGGARNGRTVGVPVLGSLKRKTLDAWIKGLQDKSLKEDDLLKLTPTPSKPPAKGQPPPPPRPSPTTTVDTLEEAADAAISEDYRHRLALATRMDVVSVNRSNNVGDQAADLQARLDGRPRAIPFTVRTRDGQHVQFDDFDFATGQPIESKAIANLVPPGTTRQEAIHAYEEQMTKEARAARDNEVAKPVRWDVPPNVHQDLIDEAWGAVPKDLRDWVVVGPPRPLIQVRPPDPPPPPPPPPPKPPKK